MAPLIWTPRERMPKHGDRDGEFVFDEPRADAAVAWFPKYLRFADGDVARQPFRPQPWQGNIVRSLYGWRRSDGRRRYRSLLIGIPRGNGKTVLGAGFCVKGLVGDNVIAPQVIGAGTDRENASHIYRNVSGMVWQHRALLKRLRPVDSTRRIVRRRGDGFYRVISADAQHAHGMHPTELLVDDLQAQESREFIDVLASSQGTVADPLMIQFMTAGFDTNSVGYERWERGLRVLEQPELDPEMLVYLYYLEPTDDWEDPAMWRKANPNLGVSVQEDFIAAQVRDAREMPAKQNSVLRLHFNIWTQQETRWMDLAKYDASSTVPLGSLGAMKGRRCFVAVDLASNVDVAAVSYLFPPDGRDAVWRHFGRYYVPAPTVGERSRRDKVPYDAWVRDGLMVATAGATTDYDVIADEIVANAKRFDIAEVVFDRWGSPNFVQKLERASLRVRGFGQGYKEMSPATKAFERLVLRQVFCHGGDRVLRWMVGNIVIEQDAAGNYKPSKARSREKIDGAVTAIMAVGAAEAAGKALEWVAY